MYLKGNRANHWVGLMPKFAFVLFVTRMSLFLFFGMENSPVGARLFSGKLSVAITQMTTSS